MRGTGRTFKRPNTAAVWIAYCHNGREIRESSHSADPKVAEKLLKQRLAEIGADRMGARAFVGPAGERVTFEDLAAAYLEDYQVRGLRSRDTAASRVAHLRRTFGLDRAVDITSTRLRHYQAARLAEGAEAGTINRELAALHRMFQLAVTAGVFMLTPRQTFPARLEENPPRQGFFEHPEYLAIRAHLPPDYQDVLDFAYYTGWRRQEIVRLAWREVDLSGGVIRLDPERSKTRTGRLLPLSPPLRGVLARRAGVRRLEMPLVFHAAGAPIGDWRKTWGRACRLAGLPGKTLHDCRRTAARNLVRAGVPERIAMAMLGHKTRSIFDRYNIVSEADLHQAAGRLAEYVSAQPSAPVVIPLARAAEASAR